MRVADRQSSPSSDMPSPAGPRAMLIWTCGSQLGKLFNLKFVHPVLLSAHYLIRCFVLAAGTWWLETWFPLTVGSRLQSTCTWQFIPCLDCSHSVLQVSAGERHAVSCWPSSDASLGAWLRGTSTVIRRRFSFAPLSRIFDVTSMI